VLWVPRNTALASVTSSATAKIEVVPVMPMETAVGTFPDVGEPDEVERHGQREPDGGADPEPGLVHARGRATLLLGDLRHDQCLVRCDDQPSAQSAQQQRAHARDASSGEKCSPRWK
jgi:hypothetical protein